METDFRALLKADSSVSGLATAVEWDEAKQGTALPFVILEMGFDARDKRMDGPQVTRVTKVRAKCFHAKAADGHNLREYVIAACEGATGATHGNTKFLGIFPTVMGLMQVDTPDGLRNCQIVDLDIAHTPIP